MTMAQPALADAPVLRISRSFAAPRDRVFRAFTAPAQLARWWGPKGFTVPACTLDVRVGGAWRLTMYAEPGRRVIHWKGEFQEVVEPERLVFTVSDRPDEVYELVTVVLADLGDGRTEMHFEQRGHMSAEQYQRAENGWGMFFDVIAKHLSNT